MKFNLLLLATISSLASANPFSFKKNSNPYLVCKNFDIKCKIEQSKLCNKKVSDCFRTNYKKPMDCIKLNNFCNEIWLNNNNNNKPKPTSTKPQPIQTTEPVINSFEPTKDNVKIIGRAKYMNDSLWVGQTDSGIEFKMNGKTATIVISTDSIYGSLSKESPAHVFVYGDNKFISDAITTESSTEINVEFDEVGEHIVSLIKISECQYGSIYIDEIKTDSKVITPTPAKDKKIEFIGDSITCAFGAVDAQPSNYRSMDEDGTKSFAYKVAQKLNADYSIFAFSGFGVYSGFNFDGIRNTDSLLPPIYDKLGTLQWNKNYPESTTIPMDSVDWDHSEFEPDLIVINLGTNDAAYINTIASDDVRETEKINFTNAYKDFIAQIRSVHPNAQILCTLGSMGQDLYLEIETAVNSYIKETNDDKVNAFPLNVQDIENNGEGLYSHPSRFSQVDSANEILEKIEELYGWIPDPNVDISEKRNNEN